MATTAMPPVFELRDILVRHGTKTVLDLALHITRGSTTVLIGPSGSGKSTLLRLLLGLARPDRGEVRFDGQPLLEDLRGVRRRVGYVIQDGGLFPHLSAYENVQLPARGWREAEARGRIHELALLVRLPIDLLEQYPLQLSGGQKQRVGLMRALMLDPEVLLLDEPFGALDPIIRAGLREDLRRIAKTLKKTIVLVTHDFLEAATLADEIVLIREGSVVQRGAVRELVEDPVDSFVTTFIQAQGVAPQALLEIG
jgi:osmoprotectant transport system ATP-binding protein